MGKIYITDYEHSAYSPKSKPKIQDRLLSTGPLSLPCQPHTSTNMPPIEDIYPGKKEKQNKKGLGVAFFLFLS